MSGYFVTQEQTDVHFSGFINTVFLLSLLLLSRFIGYVCNMQKVTSIRGVTCHLGALLPGTCQIARILKVKIKFQMQQLYLNQLLLCDSVVSQAHYTQFWRGFVRVEDSRGYRRALLMAAHACWVL